MSASDHEQAIPTDASPIERLFHDAPPDVGLAFMIVEHPSRDFNTVMSELVSRRVARAVHRVEHGMTLRPDAVYLVPGGVSMRIRHGAVELDAVSDEAIGDGVFVGPHSPDAPAIELRRLPDVERERQRVLALFRDPRPGRFHAKDAPGRPPARGPGDSSGDRDLLAGVYEADRVAVTGWLRRTLGGDVLVPDCECRVRRGEGYVRVRLSGRPEAGLGGAERDGAREGASALDRHALTVALERQLSQSRRSCSSLAVILVDCDDLERVIARDGRLAGDRVLREMASRLAATLRPSDWVARVGDDEFLAVLPDTRMAEGLLVAEKLRRAVAEYPMTVAGEMRTITASFGAAVISPHVHSADDVLACAYDALSRSRLRGEGRVRGGAGSRAGRAQPASPADPAGVRGGKGFRTVVQPIWDLRSNTVIGFEMLSRGPEGPLERPEELFRLCMDTDSLTEVDLACLGRAVRGAARLEPDRRVHVNLFPSTIMRADVAALVDLFTATGMPERFCLEISEQQLVGNPSALLERTSRLKSHGIEIAVDDVGFGRSSLETLIVLEPDVIKIDRSMVTGVSRQPGLKRSLDRLMQVSNGLDARLIAEGIETREDRVTLLDMGVSAGQGFLWGKPYSVA